MLKPFALAVFIAPAILARTIPARSQSVTFSDSAQIGVVALLASLDTFRIQPDSTRLWLSVINFYDHPPSTAITFLNRILPEIRAKFVGARLAPPWSELFLCPSGVQVRMPGRGCPTLENGVIVRVGNFRFAADSVAVSVSLIRSEGDVTWEVGHVMILSRDKGGWKIVRLTERFMT